MSNRVTNRGLVVTGTQSDEMGELTSLLADIEGFTVGTVPEWDLPDHLSSADPSALVVVDDPPASDGIGIFRDVRESGATLPIVLVGSNVTPDRVETAIAAGVTDYITTGDDTQVAELTARLRAHIRYPMLDGYVESQRWDRTIGSLSHDMKNPLNVVSGRLELLDVDETHAGAIDRSIARVESLLDEVSRVAANRPAADAETVDIADTARRVWTEVSDGEGTLDVETDLTVESDPEVVTILFRRLFENALAHGGDDVTVTVGDTDDGFFVADDGPGVPDDAKPRVFEQGYGTAREGEGYGLFVASRIAAANGWAITVGDSDDGGARFDVRSR